MEGLSSRFLGGAEVKRQLEAIERGRSEPGLLGAKWRHLEHLADRGGE